jgi:ParB family chromosome partitioning protein
MLISDEKLFGGRRVVEIPIDDIDPNDLQPRKQFDRESLEELAASIDEHGVLQPILVRRKGTRYEIVAGERRVQACMICGMKSVPATIIEADDTRSLLYALIENLQREDLNPIDEAEGLQLLIDRCGLTQEDLSAKVGKRRATITNTLRLLKLPDEVKRLLATGALSRGHARALLSLQDRDLQIRAAARIVERGMSVRETEQLVLKLKNQAAARRPRRTKKPTVQPETRSAVEEFGKRIAKAARVRVTGERIKLEIVFESEKELQDFLERCFEKGR